MLFLAILLTSVQIKAAPEITGVQVNLESRTINWPKTWDQTSPAIGGGANQINDLNANINYCDLVISTAGNYNAALSEFMRDVFLPDNFYLSNYGNVLWTTSPPISIGHAQNKELIIGNFKTGCSPSVAVGPARLMASLDALGLSTGEAVPFMQNQGNALIVKKGNPHDIQSVFDLARPGQRFVTSDLRTEKGSGGNYSNSIYNIALAERGKAAADNLFNRIYNNDTVNGGESNYVRWGPIMHRSIPQAIVNGQAAAGMCFYHLCKQWATQFPDEFEIVPLGGTAENPEPVEGNKIATLFIVEMSGNSHLKRHYARRLIHAYMSDEFTDILAKHGILRP